MYKSGLRTGTPHFTFRAEPFFSFFSFFLSSFSRFSSSSFFLLSSLGEGDAALVLFFSFKPVLPFFFEGLFGFLNTSFSSPFFSSLSFFTGPSLLSSCGGDRLGSSSFVSSFFSSLLPFL